MRSCVCVCVRVQELDEERTRKYKTMYIHTRASERMKSCEFYSRVREKLCASTYKSIAKVCCVHSHGRDRVINVSRFRLLQTVCIPILSPSFA